MNRPTDAVAVDGESARYIKAMIAGRLEQCASIEQRHDLYGYPPELVSVGLKAYDEGRNPHFAIDEYISSADSDARATNGAQT